VCAVVTRWHHGAMHEPATSGRVAGEVLIRADIVLTTVFAATALYAAVSFSTFSQWVGAVTAITLFAVGVFTFLWAYWNAVQRSRDEEISVVQLYLLAGPPTPPLVRRTMNGALVTQALVAIGTTLARPDGPDGNPGSSLAVGFLVPMLGFGLNGLWAAYHADFPPRLAGGGAHRAPAGGDADGGRVPTPGDEIGQNADHG
jgi:hypothetical protein